MLPEHAASRPASWFPKLLLVLYLLEFSLLGIHPAERSTWVAENGPIFLIVVALVVLYLRGVRFSNLAYALMSVLIFLHTIGGYYTFEKVPFAWFNNLFGFKRNMFDRVAHVTVGFYAFAIIEQTDRRGTIRSRAISYLFPLCVIGTVAMSYELLEWIYADLSDPAAGAAFLGSQGDIWDAQKDMLADTSGAVLALALYWLRRRTAPVAQA
jgi:putative membrane protein